MSNYLVTSSHYRRNGGSWWSPLSGGITPTGATSGSVNKYETRFRFDFDAIRTMNISNYIVSASFNYKSTNEYSNDTVIIKVADLNYVTLAGGVSGESIKGAWASIDLNPEMINKLTDSTAYYFGTYNTSSSTYIEIYGEGVDAPYLSITWATRNSAPTWPASPSLVISSTGLVADGNNYIAATNVNLSWSTALDDNTPTASLLYYLEYRIGTGSWQQAMNWTANTLSYNFIFSTFSIAARGPSSVITFRVTAKDGGGLITPTLNSSKGVYLVQRPVMGNGWTASGTITGNTSTVTWNVPTVYNSIIGVQYVLEFYDGYTDTWKTPSSLLSGLSLSLVNIYSDSKYLGLAGAFRDRFYRSNCKIRLTPRTNPLQGIMVTGVTGTSASFLIDYSVAPVLTSVSIFPTTAQFETQNITPDLTKGAQGNLSTAAGISATYYMVYDYYVGENLVYSKSYSNTPVSWANLAAQANQAYAIPSSIIGSGLNDVNIIIKSKIIASTGLSSTIVTTNYTVKRYKTPIVNITGIVRNQTSVDLDFIIVDTGLGSGGTIGTTVLTNLSGSAITGLVTYLTNQITFATTETASGVVQLAITNNPVGGTTPSGLTGYATQVIPSFLPNFRVMAPSTGYESGGVVIKGEYYRFNEVGAPVNISDGYLASDGTAVNADKLGNALASDYRLRASTILTGDATSGSFWRSQTAGSYNNSNNSLSNCPTPYGLIILERYGSDFSLTYYQQATGPTWRTSGNSDTVTCVWRKYWDDGNLTPANYLEATRRKNNTTNTTVSSQLIQSGWAFGSSSTGYIDIPVTFPTTFSDVPVLTMTMAGAAKAKSSGDPSNPGDIPSLNDIQGFCNYIALSNSGFTARLTRSMNFSSSYNYPFNWMAIGSK